MLLEALKHELGPLSLIFFVICYFYFFLVRDFGPLPKTTWTKSDEFSIFGRGYLGAPMKVGHPLGKILATPLTSSYGKLVVNGIVFNE